MSRQRVRQPFSHLSEFERGHIVGLRERNAFFWEIARYVGRSVSVVQRVCSEWFEEGRTTRRERSGRPTLTNSRDDRHLLRKSLSDRSAPSSALVQQWRTVTRYSMYSATVRCCLLQYGLHARHALQRLPWTIQHKTARLQWCIERSDWKEEW